MKSTAVACVIAALSLTACGGDDRPSRTGELGASTAKEAAFPAGHEEQRSFLTELFNDPARASLFHGVAPKRPAVIASWTSAPSPDASSRSTVVTVRCRNDDGYYLITMDEHGHIQRISGYMR
jgi:hypothetical protein